MKSYVSIALYIWTSSICWSQKHEFGFFIGGTNYVGDIGKTSYISPNSPGSSIIYKFNLNTRIALRGTYSFFLIRGDDRNSENTIRRTRGYSFSKDINELALGLEYNFFEYDLSSRKKISTPYLHLGLAGFDFQTQRGSHPVSGILFTQKTSLAIPMGIGWKTRVYGRIAFAVESTVRYTFTDELDYPKNVIPNMSFDGNGNDWYMFTGVSLVYTFGRPSCYLE